MLRWMASRMECGGSEVSLGDVPSLKRELMFCVA